MAIYKLSDILDCLHSMDEDGFEYVSIDEIDDDQDDDLPVLCIDALYDESTAEGEMIDAIILPRDYHSPNS